MVFLMPDRISASAATESDGKSSPLDWHIAAPALDLRWFIFVALLMPMLLVVGVYWIRTAPIGPASSPSGSVVQVRLISQPDRKEIEPATAVQPSPTEVSRSDILVEDARHAIPDDRAASVQAEAEPASQPVTISAPASPSIPATAKKTSLTAAMFQRTLLSHIARYRQYPDQARRDRMQGIVQLVFAMRRNGTVTDVWVKTSSGHVTLDQAAVDTIFKAQPLPSIPADMPDELNIAMPVDFSLP